MNTRLIRSVNSTDGKKYFLLDDRMQMVIDGTRDGYTYFNLSSENRLSLPVVKKMFKKKKGKTRNWSFELNNGILRVGCQQFTGGNLLGIMRWAGEANV